MASSPSCTEFVEATKKAPRRKLFIFFLPCSDPVEIRLDHRIVQFFKLIRRPQKAQDADEAVQIRFDLFGISCMNHRTDTEHQEQQKHTRESVLLT